MSQGVVIRRILGTSRIFLPDLPAVSVFRYASKKNSTPNPFTKQPTRSKDLTHTTVMVQDRLDIQEVPTIVRNVRTPEVIGNSVPENKDLFVVSKESQHPYNFHKEQTFVDRLLKCHDVKELYNMIKELQDDELSSSIVLCALERIIEVENNAAFRNMLRGSNNLSVKRMDVLDKLINNVVAHSDSSILLDALSSVSRDAVGTKGASYKEKLINEILMRANDRKFSIHQMCEIVNLLSVMKCERKQDILDGLWIGLIDRGREINENNIGEVFRVLPYLKQSQKMIFNMLTRKCEDVWWRLNSSAIVEILNALQEIQVRSSQTLGLMARSASTNINSVSDDDMLQIIKSFSGCDYVDDNIGKILEKYVKNRGHKFKNTALMETLVEYCTKFRLRFTSVLDVCADYLISHCSDLSPVHFKSLLTPMGYFHHLPSNGVKFWQPVEDYMMEKFILFRPEDIVDVALACVYLEKFPLNLTSKILNPYFLDRMHTCRSGYELQQLRTKLKIFDAAMTLECSQYQGPLLPRDYAVKNLPHDGRIKRAVKYIYDVVADVVGSYNRVSTGILMPQLPASDLYLVDVLLHPEGMETALNRIKPSCDRDLFIAILIHLPEHFCSKEEHLIGPQMMKRRHLKLLGLSVISLKYSEILKIKGKKDELKNYIIDKIENLENSTV